MNHLSHYTKRPKKYPFFNISKSFRRKRKGIHTAKPLLTYRLTSNNGDSTLEACCNQCTVPVREYLRSKIPYTTELGVKGNPDTSPHFQSWPLSSPEKRFTLSKSQALPFSCRRATNDKTVYRSQRRDLSYPWHRMVPLGPR